MITITLVLISLAAMCNAIMDKVDHHYYRSVFSNMKNPLWWNQVEGWKNKYVDRDPEKGRVKWLWGLINKPVQLTDAWHFFKMWMVIFMCSAVVTASITAWYENPKWYSCIILLITFGFVWNSTFNVFYNKLLEK